MRTCSVERCIWPVFGTDKNTGLGYCTIHQWHRTDLKRKRPYKKEESDRWDPVTSFGYMNQYDMFLQLWHDADGPNGVICPFTKERLNFYKHRGNYWFSCFSHIIPKGKYPLFKLNPDNIRIVYPEFHRIVDQGRFEDRKGHPEWKFDEWDRLVLEMKEKYRQFKKDNLLP